MTEHGRKRDEIKAEIENGFTKEVLKINAGPMLAEWNRAVSYTHLDVYKRQVTSCATN